MVITAHKRNILVFRSKAAAGNQVVVNIRDTHPGAFMGPRK